MPQIVSKTYQLQGAREQDEILQVRLNVSLVPRVGAVAAEVHDDGTAILILKYEEGAEPDEAALRDAVRAAGPFDLTS